MLTVKVIVGKARQGGSYDASSRDAFQPIIKNFKKVVKNLEDVTPEVLLYALRPTFEKSQEYCPVDKGTLLRSGFLEENTFRGKPRVSMGYGRGGVPPYAAAVHENLEWQHKYPTRAKWLQVAIDEDASDIQARIVERYRRFFR